MDDELAPMDAVERELAELKDDLQEGFAALKGISDMRQQVADVVETYNQAKALLEQAKEQVAHLETSSSRVLEQVDAKLSSLEARFKELKDENASKWHSYQEQIVKSHASMQQANQRARSELAERIDTLQGSVEAELENHGEKLAKLNDELVEDINQRLRDISTRFDALKGNVQTDIARAIDRMQMEIDNVDSRTNSAVGIMLKRLDYITESQRRTKWRIWVVRILAIVALAIAALHAGIALYPLMGPYLASFF